MGEGERIQKERRLLVFYLIIYYYHEILILAIRFYRAVACLLMWRTNITEVKSGHIGPSHPGTLLPSTLLSSHLHPHLLAPLSFPCTLYHCISVPSTIAISSGPPVLTSPTSFIFFHFLYLLYYLVRYLWSAARDHSTAISQQYPCDIIPSSLISFYPSLMNVSCKRRCRPLHHTS